MMSWTVSAMLLLCYAPLEGQLQERSRQPSQFSGRPFNLDTKTVVNSGNNDLDTSEVLLTTVELATKYGYPVETHSVTTEDGYVLSIFRIPGSPRAASAGVKTPVLLMHSMLVSSDIWLLTGPDKGLGFILADAGYDVWMGNARGNRYSRDHVSLTHKDAAYFNFTWHQMGTHDLPVVIDYVLETTNHKQLFYVGHCMGITMFFVLASAKPEYNQKVRLVVAMAPTVYVWGLKSNVRALLPLTKTIYRGFMNADEWQLSVKLEPAARLVNEMCADGKPFQEACMYAYFAFMGFNRKEMNTTLLPSMVMQMMSGYNTVQLITHYAQLAKTEKFQNYNRNGHLCGNCPEYPLANVSAPVALIYSLNDVMVPPEGIIHLSKQLPNVVKLIRVADDTANHGDFVYAIHVKELVNNHILGLMEKF